MRLTPYRWNTWPGLTGLREEMNELFDAFAPARTTLETWPPVDVVETPETILVTAELPGVEPKDIDISVVGDMLTIKGEKRLAHEEKGKTFYRRELAGGAFRRMVRLPVPVDARGITAEDKAGVLTVTLPKAEVVKPRKIEIKMKS